MPVIMPEKPAARRRKDARLVGWLVALVAGMTALSFAAVPLYAMFCQVTGYGGTTQRAAAAPSAITDREVSVRLDANTAPGLPWSFRPEQREIKLKIGENRLAFYSAVNTSGAAATGTATFNVTPEIAGSYFSKIECFCFQEQTLEAGQRVEFPVSFFVDPAILQDKDASYIQEITLSYTFFPLAKSAARSASPAPGQTGGAAKSPIDPLKNGG